MLTLMAPMTTRRRRTMPMLPRPTRQRMSTMTRPTRQRARLRKTTRQMSRAKTKPSKQTHDRQLRRHHVGWLLLDGYPTWALAVHSALSLYS
jgi:hypothetical protein